MTNTNQMSWQDKANCVGKSTSLFFFDVGVGGNPSKAYKEARSICMSCEVAKECYDFAVSNNEQYGVWGGVNFSQRHKYGSKQREYKINKQHEDFTKEYNKQ